MFEQISDSLLKGYCNIRLQKKNLARPTDPLKHLAERATQHFFLGGGGALYLSVVFVS